MKTLHFAKTIDAPRERVWQALIGKESYKNWTAPFMEGSYFEGSWNKGDKIRFLGPDGGGMTSVIADNRLHEFISIKHIGEVKNGKDDLDSESVRRWAPAFENYSLKDVAGGTEVTIDLDVTEDFEAQMKEQWPLALDKLKELSETHRHAATV